METKPCVRCKILKPTTEFGKVPVNKDGLSGRCRACIAELQRIKRSTDPDYRERQRQSNIESCRRRYKAHPAKPIADFGDWQTQGLVVGRINAAKFQAKKFGAIGNDFSLADWVAITAAQQGICFYCRKPSVLEIEHKTPLALGGDNTASNVVGACHTCNWSKRLRTAEQFLNNLCANDHLQTPENIYTYPGGKKHACKVCRRASLKRYRDKKSGVT